jgi:hypothetical protein
MFRFFKYFYKKKIGEKITVFGQTFLGFFLQKFAKIAENCDHNTVV